MSSDGQDIGRVWQISVRKRAVFVAIVTLVATVLVGLLAEGAVRLRQRLKHGTAAPFEESFAIDAASGLRVPLAAKSPKHIFINSLGFRSPELVVPKPPGTVRVAFLGASTTFCGEVSSNEATWPYVVWRALHEAHPDVQLDYVNAAVPGYSVNSSLRNLEYRVKPLHPDVIVLYEGFNDLSYDTAALALRHGLTAGRADEESWLERHSVLWFLVAKNVRIWRRQADAERKVGKLEFDAGEASKTFEARLSNLVRASQQVAPVVALVTLAPRMRPSLSPNEQRRAAVTALYYMPYMTIDGILQGYAEYNRAIRRVAADRGTLLIETEAAIPADAAYYTDSIHFTDTGSRAMAHHVSRTLLASPRYEALMTDRVKRF